MKEEESLNFLEKKFKEEVEMTVNETVSAAIMCLQSVCTYMPLACHNVLVLQVLASDFKSADVEICLAEKGQRVRVLTNEEVDEYLTSIAERD